MTDDRLPVGDRDEKTDRRRQFFSRAPIVDNDALERFLKAYDFFKRTGRYDDRPENEIDRGDAYEAPNV